MRATAQKSVTVVRSGNGVMIQVSAFRMAVCVEDREGDQTQRAASLHYLACVRQIHFLLIIRYPVNGTAISGMKAGMFSSHEAGAGTSRCRPGCLSCATIGAEGKPRFGGPHDAFAPGALVGSPG